MSLVNNELNCSMCGFWCLYFPRKSLLYIAATQDTGTTASVSFIHRQEKLYRKKNFIRRIFINQLNFEGIKDANHTHNNYYFNYRLWLGRSERKGKKVIDFVETQSQFSHCPTSKRILNASQWVCLFHVYNLLLIVLCAYLVEGFNFQIKTYKLKTKQFADHWLFGGALTTHTHTNIDKEQSCRIHFERINLFFFLHSVISLRKVVKIRFRFINKTKRRKKKI